LVKISASKILKNIFPQKVISLNQSDLKEIAHYNDYDIDENQPHFNVKIKPEFHKEVEQNEK